MRAPGYTLVEVIVAVAIFAVLAAAALPLVAPVNENKLDAAAGEVANALRFAQTEALRTGGYYGVDFSVDVGVGARRIRVFRTDTATPPNPVYDVRHPLDKKFYDIRLGDGNGTAGVNVTDAKFYYQSGATLVVRDWAAFDASGTPAYYPDAGNYQSYSNPPNVSEVTLASGDNSATVRLDPVTGRVTRN